MKFFFLFFFLFVGPLIAEEDFVIVDGDIAVKKPLDKSSFLRSATRWPGGVIPWEIDQNDLKKPSLIGSIKGAIDILHQNTNLVFKKRTAKDKNYLIFTSKREGCFSYVGMQGGPQEVNLSYGCHLNLIVAHEILHAIGMEHEQSRDDRDNFITILWDNIDESQKYNFGLVRKSSFGSYNLNSIMHYGSYSFSKNGKPTMVTKDGTVFDQNLKFFTKGDQEAVNNFYPFKFNFDLEQVGLKVGQESELSYIQIDAPIEIVKSIQTVTYRINNRETSNDLDSWENNFPYNFDTLKGKNTIHVTFSLKDNTKVEKEFFYFFTGRKLQVNCRFEAKQRQIDFKVPVSYSGEEITSENQEIKDYFAEVSAIFDTRRNTIDLKMAVGRKSGLIRREERQEEVFTVIENETHKVEGKNAELTCDAINEAL